MDLNKGKLIVIEGLEGAGKSTAVATIVSTLNQAGIKTHTTREPGGTEIGEQLRSIIKNPIYKNKLEDKSELLLLYAARAQLLAEVIKPALDNGEWVVADRFELSTKAYQGGGRGINQSIINQLSQFCLDGFKPDLTFYLDISPELGIERAKSRGQFDRIEQQAIDFFHKVHQCYLSCIAEEPNLIMINATLPRLEVQNNLKKALLKFLERL